MSYQEKRTIVSMATTAVTLAAYCVYALARLRSGALDPGDLRSWALAILVFVGVLVIASIVIQVVFHVLLSAVMAAKAVKAGEPCDREVEESIEASMVDDEMVKLIEMKASRWGFACSGVGFVVALSAAALGAGAAATLSILFLSFGASALVDGAAQLRHFRKGVGNG